MTQTKFLTGFLFPVVAGACACAFLLIHAANYYVCSCVIQTKKPLALVHELKQSLFVMSKAKFDIYETITDQLLELIDQGVCPWRQPWKSIGGIPRNYKGRAYRGANVVLLSLTAMVKGYEKEIWLTYKQAKECGGSIRKGEKSTMVLFASLLVPKEYKHCPEDCPAKEKSFMMRYFRVFNIQQTENVKLPKWAEAEEIENDNGPLATAEAVIEGMPNPPTISRRGGRAYYLPSDDKVVVPAIKKFDDSESFYSVLFHELAHSTGHADRLDREGITDCDKFGSDQYAFEELVAEFGSSFLCGHCGIDSRLPASAAYLKGWAKRFREDKNLFFRAASQAQKAADYILNVTF